jgi:hypothetical protein
VSLYGSTVTGSTTQNSGDGSAVGGGIRAYLVELAQSTVSGNTASASGAPEGGGIYANIFYASRSTISGNAAKRAAGILAGAVHLSSSTVSGNQTPLTGTVGASTQRNWRKSSTVRLPATPAAAMSPQAVWRFRSWLTRSCTADHRQQQGQRSRPRYRTTAGKVIPGSSNLINAHQAQTFLPADTISGDPRLGPLRDNGGPTQTLELLPGSSAIDTGSNAFGIRFDQRGVPRVEGIAADIGAFESDRIFSDGFNL